MLYDDAMRFAFLTCLCLLFSFISMAAEEVALPPEAQAVVDRFVAEGAKQVTDADTKRAAVKAKLEAALEALQTAEGKAGRLESAVAVQHLHAEVSAGTPLDMTKPGAGLPKGVTRPLETHQADMGKIDKDFAARLAAMREQAIKDLEAVKIAQTKAGHLDVALAVKQTQEQLRGGQPAARVTATVLVLGKGAQIEPTDEALLRHGGTDSTIEAVLTAVASDGLIFRCGAGANGQSMAIVADELWYAVVGGRVRTVIKAPLNGAKPPLHLAVTFAKGDVALWVNGTLAKHEKTELEMLGDNGAGGGVGAMGETQNHQAMPHEGFTGELASFRYVDRVLYTAPFKLVFPMPASAGIRWQIDPQGLPSGPLKELAAAKITGPISVKR